LEEELLLLLLLEEEEVLLPLFEEVLLLALLLLDTDELEDAVSEESAVLSLDSDSLDAVSAVLSAEADGSADADAVLSFFVVLVLLFFVFVVVVTLLDEAVLLLDVPLTAPGTKITAQIISAMTATPEQIQIASFFLSCRISLNFSLAFVKSGFLKLNFFMFIPSL
jgi:hypothetical protein